MIIAIEQDHVIWLAYSNTNYLNLSKADSHLSDNVPLYALPKADGAIAGFCLADITTDITRYHFLEELDTVSRDKIEQMLNPLNEALEQYGVNTKENWNNALIVAQNGLDSFECITPAGKLETWQDYYCFGTSVEKRIALGRLSQTEDMPPKDRIADVFRVLGKWTREDYYPVAVMNTDKRELTFLEEEL